MMGMEGSTNHDVESQQTVSSLKLQQAKVGESGNLENNEVRGDIDLSREDGGNEVNTGAQKGFSPSKLSPSKKGIKHALRQQAKRRRKNTNIASGCNSVPRLQSQSELDEMNVEGVCYRQPTMAEVLSSIPGFNMKPRKRSNKKLSAAAQLEQTKEGCVDLETPDSILVNANLRQLLNKHTFSSLPPLYQYKLLQLLPHVDRTPGHSEYVYRLSSSGLNNEFFARACMDWKERLAEGEFTPENQAKLKAEQEKEKTKLDPWKLKHFEPMWGESLEEWPSIPTSVLERSGLSGSASPHGQSSAGTSPTAPQAAGKKKKSGSWTAPIKLSPPPPPPRPVRTVGAVTRAVSSYREKRQAELTASLPNKKLKTNQDAKIENAADLEVSTSAVIEDNQPDAVDAPIENENSITPPDPSTYNVESITETVEEKLSLPNEELPENPPCEVVSENQDPEVTLEITEEVEPEPVEQPVLNDDHLINEQEVNEKVVEVKIDENSKELNETLLSEESSEENQINQNIADDIGNKVEEDLQVSITDTIEMIEADKRVEPNEIIEETEKEMQVNAIEQSLKEGISNETSVSVSSLETTIVYSVSTCSSDLSYGDKRENEDCIRSQGTPESIHSSPKLDDWEIIKVDPNSESLLDDQGSRGCSNEGSSLSCVDTVPETDKMDDGSKSSGFNTEGSYSNPADQVLLYQDSLKEDEAALLAAAWDAVGSTTTEKILQDIQNHQLAATGEVSVIPCQEELEVRLEETSLPRWETSQPQQAQPHGHVKLELEVTLTPEVDSQVSSSTADGGGMKEGNCCQRQVTVIPPTTIVCLPPTPAPPPLPPPLAPTSSSALPYIQLSTSTPVRALSTKTITKSIAAGRSIRNSTNKPPPGAVNLERSYQICQAVIQNSPNRDQLQGQLRPPPSLLTKSTGNPAGGATRQAGTAPPPPSLGTPRPPQRLAKPPLLLKHVFTSQHGIPVNMAVLPNSPHHMNNNHQMSEYVMMRSGGLRRSNSAPPSAAEVGVAARGSVQLVTGSPRPASVGIQLVGSQVSADCSCSLKPMQACLKCGAFCHHDCITPSRLCVTCDTS